MKRRNFIKGALACLAAPIAAATAAAKTTTPSPANPIEDAGVLGDNYISQRWEVDDSVDDSNRLFERELVESCVLEPGKPNLNGDILPEHIHSDGIVFHCEMLEISDWNTAPVPLEFHDGIWKPNEDDFEREELWTYQCKVLNDA